MNPSSGREREEARARLSFFGAAETVTGSRYLLEARGSRILVDCGLFQGLKKLRQRNWSNLPFDVESLDAVVLTHGHIDHSGYLPKLCQLGFLLHLIGELMEARRIPSLPVYLDSPMAIDATELFRKHTEDHRLVGGDGLRLAQVARYAHTAEESKAIDASSGPMIIISASGMATGGRVLHHLRRFLPDPKSHVLLVGYQAAGTRGRSLLDGAEELKIHGQYVRVRARVSQLEGLSAHADYAEMIEWLGRAQLDPRRVFVTHGEPSASDALRRRLREAFGWRTEVPEFGARVTLGA